jgi:MFS family permease
MSFFAFLDKQRTIAPPGFHRWLVPPAALAIHLAIGQAYAFSVFNVPLTRSLGITQSTPEDWTLPTVGWIFSLSMVFLGLSAAVFGTWLERAGPRKAMLASACCFGGGFLVSALAVHLHSIVLLYLGYGVLGGIGLGLGYISPVSTLIRWFPDRPGMATGMAIMGFGGGAMIGSPFGVGLLRAFQGPTSTGVGEAFLVMGVSYFLFMLFGALIVRLPPPGWKPAGYVPPVVPARLVTTNTVTANAAIATPQFYLLWAVLFLNVTAGIGILGQASLMIQEMFLQGMPADARIVAGGGFVALLSLFNMGGRFFWSSLSDVIGRKSTYYVFFLLGAVLYGLIPELGQLGNVALFVAVAAVILSMYGGGFATIPAYLRDLFGTLQVGAIHGRLLTAWSAAGIAGPVLVNYIRQAQVAQGVPPALAYNITMYLVAGLLVVGAVCNLLVAPVHARFHRPDDLEGKLPATPPAHNPEPGNPGVGQTALQADNPGNRADHTPGGSPVPPPTPAERPKLSGSTILWLTLSWLWVGIPLAWGVVQTAIQAAPLFR